LSWHDINVLEKLKDPEFDPSLLVQVDPSLPKDPIIYISRIVSNLFIFEAEKTAIILSYPSLDRSLQVVASTISS
jgi:hypothetical protein